MNETEDLRAEIARLRERIEMLEDAQNDLLTKAFPVNGIRTPSELEPRLLAAILTHLPRLTDEHPSGLTTTAILDALYPGPRADEPPDGWEELRRALESATETKAGARPDARRLGTYLAGQRDKTIGLGDGRKARLVILSTKANAKRWGVR